MKVPRLDAATGAITWTYEPAPDQLSSLAPPPPPPAELSMPPHHRAAHAPWQLQQEHTHVMPPVHEQHAVKPQHKDAYSTCQQSPWQDLVPAAPPPPQSAPPHPPRDRVVVNLTPDAKPKPPKGTQCHREMRWVGAVIIVMALLLAVWATLVLLEVMPLPWATGGDSGSSSDAPSPAAPPAAPPGQL